MKKYSVAILLSASLMLLPIFDLPVSANTTPARIYTSGTSGIKPCPVGTYRVRKRSKRGRQIVNSLIAGGIGAAIGGGIGGGRGALIGLGSGAGGYLVYRYVRDRRGRCVPRYVRG